MRKIRSVIGYFEKSTQATKKLLDFQRNSHIPEYRDQPHPKKLFQDVITRWWSTFRSLRRARFLKKAIKGLLATEEVSCENLSPLEWGILHQIEIALETMAHFQRVLEGENYVTASLVPVAVYQIRKNYQEVIDDDNTLSVVKALTETLLADFDKRYHTSGGNKLGYTNVALVGFGNRYTTVHHYFFIAAFLDPRTKLLLKDMMTDINLQQLEHDIFVLMMTEKALMKDQRNNHNNPPEEEVATQDQNASVQTAASLRMARMFHGLKTTGMAVENQEEDEEEDLTRSKCHAELRKFKHGNVSIDLHKADGTFNDPLMWWKKNESSFTLLARLARMFLAIPATSAPSERIWSRVSRILCLQRASLKPEVAQRIMFVKENLHILRKHYRALVLADRDNDDFLVELEMSYLFGDDDNEDAEIDVGQSDE